MLKKSFLRGASGYCISLTATMLASLVSALCGAEHLCMPGFIARVGDETLAFILQSLLMSLIGFAFGASSIFFEIERWSYLKQGTMHFAVTAAVWMVAEMICFAPVTSPVVLSSSLSIAATYFITWTIQYFVRRAQIRKLDAQIRMKNEEYTP